MSKPGTISIEIGRAHWEVAGPVEDPRSHLIASIKINGASIFLEAYAVTEKFEPEIGLVQNWGEHAGGWAAEAVAKSADFDPVETVRIDGFKRRYVLIATPYAK